MRKTILGLVFAAGLAGGAQAADFVVVGSTDPTLKPGLELDAGQRIALGAGKTLTLMTAGGAVSTLRGGASGAVTPRAAGPVDGTRMAALKVLVDPPPSGRTFGARRSGVCPDPATLTTLDEILAVQSSGCQVQARTALDAYVARTAQPDT